MAYIGPAPKAGQNREVDDISSGFNGSTTAFTLQVDGSNVSPGSANNIIVSVNNVVLNPGTAYSINGSTITFTSAPTNGQAFFGLVLGQGIDAVEPADGSISTSKLADDAVNANKLANTSVTAGSYTTADITVDAQGRITAASSGAISGAEIADQAVTNAKVNNSAAIAGTKISPDFGSQAVTTTGNITGSDITANGGDLTISGSTAVLHLTDTNNDDDFSVMNENGTFIIRDASDSANRITVNSSGTVDVIGNLDVGAGVDVTGNITVTGTVDGVDIAALNTTVSGKLSDVVDDTSPQLAGNLDVQAREITTTTSNGNIKLNPNGTGAVEVRGDGSSEDGKLQLNCSQNSHGVKLESPAHSAGQSYTIKLPDNQIAADKFLKVKSISGSGSTATGQLEFADGGGAGGFTSSQQFTSNGTWTKPSGINLIRVYVTGGGGGAGGGGASGDFGAAGGAGGTAIEIIDVSSVSTVTVTVGGGGAGGAGESNGTAGSTSSFGSYCSATGGGGGTHGNFGANSGGQGGIGSGGDINLQGGDGGAGQDNSGISTQYASSFGVGGASYWGGGGGGHSHSYAPQPGRAYGSGGGATHNDNYNTGAAGKAGFVYVEQYT